jgi:predicted SAM-dependent methyltransferase
MPRIPYGLRRASFLLRSEAGLYGGVTLRGQIDGQQRKRLHDMQRQHHLKLHLACGDRLLPGWVNIDLVPMADLRLDLRDSLPLPAGCAQYIYASHYLEHLDYRREAPPFLQECHRLLERGGVLRLVVPGVEQVLRAYAAEDDAFFAEQAKLHPAWCQTRLEHVMYTIHMEGRHKFGYDYETMAKLLAAHGFEPELSSFNASRHAALNQDYRGAGLSLFVDATRP